MAAPHDATEWFSKSDKAGASGTFLNWVRLSAMTLVANFRSDILEVYGCVRAASLGRRTSTIRSAGVPGGKKPTYLPSVSTRYTTLV